LGCWISPCYGPFSLGTRFETYEPFISLIFQIVSGCSAPQITETADTESADMGVRLHIQNFIQHPAGKLTPYADLIIGDHQCGFRCNRLITDHIFCRCQILEKKFEYNEAVHQLFIDFKKP
jgi:hypothetical protein